jgi:hypothetical protein
MKIFVYFFTILCIVSCTKNKNTDNRSYLNNSSSVYSITDTSKFQYYETLYVPVYSEIYHMDGTRQMLLTVTLSVRNTSLSDSAIITRIDYFDSKGKKLRNYLDSAVVLKPLESSEYIVEYAEKEGGAGANFIVEWCASKYADQILVQAVMIGTSGQQGLSFVTESKVINQIDKTNKK